MDLTKLSDADLLALHKGDLQSISDEGLSGFKLTCYKATNVR